MTRTTRRDFFTKNVFNFIKASSAVANAYEHHASYALFLPISNYLCTRES